MVKKVGVAILGLGVVGGGAYKTLVSHHDYYFKTQNVDITVESVLVRHKEKALALLPMLPANWFFPLLWSAIRKPSPILPITARS